jgi:hypothetical protein
MAESVEERSKEEEKTGTLHLASSQASSLGFWKELNFSSVTITGGVSINEFCSSSTQFPLR